MGRYLMIESRSLWEGNDVRNFIETAAALSDRGDRIDLFLIQNGVLNATSRSEQYVKTLLARNGFRIWADDFSLASRGVPAAELVAGVREAPIARLLELLMTEGCKPVWH